MSESKVRLTMVIPGATMISSQDCEKMSKKEAYDSFSITVNVKKKKGKKQVINKEILHINTRKSIPAKQSISISREAYNYMTDKKEIPSAKLSKIWGSMANEQRLKYHLNLIAEHFNAVSFSYEILDD